MNKKRVTNPFFCKYNIIKRDDKKLTRAHVKIDTGA